MRRLLTSLQRRFDLAAVDQLRAEVHRLAEENAELKRRLAIAQEQLSLADSLAEGWQEDAMDAIEQLIEIRGGTAALDQAARLSHAAHTEARP